METVRPVGRLHRSGSFDRSDAGPVSDFVFSLIGPGHSSQPDPIHLGLGLAGTEPLVIGFDAVVTEHDGRIALVAGFLDKVPTA